MGLAILVAASSAWAQRLSGELRLQVIDSTGGVLHATGRIIGEATGVDRTFETDETGKAVFRALPLGHYEVSVRSSGFLEKVLPVEILSQLPLEDRIALDVTPLTTTVEIRDEPLLEPVQTAQYVPHQMLEERTSAAANRSVINLVNTQPGWLLEANGILHPRGSEYDVQYVVDGIPLYDNRSPAFAQLTNVEEFQSLNVRTAGYPAEFGLKLGGVIETATDQDRRPGLHGEASLQTGSFDNRDAFLSLRYSQGRSLFGIAADAMATNRYLDPPVQQNYTNRGSGAGPSISFEREWSASDRTRVHANRRTTRFMVPNELLQQTAGQRQDRGGGETLGQISHTHIFSPRMLGEFHGMIRQTRARLWSNNLATPILPAQDRGFHEGYVAASSSLHYGDHEFKGGAEGWFSSVREDLNFHIVNYRIGSVRIFDRDIPADFHFSRRALGRTQSAFAQDSWRIGNVNVSAGLRFDHYSLVADETAWSPRLAAVYELKKGRIALHASYDRVFQIPATENILLASSDLAQKLGGGAFLPLRPSRGNFVEAGFSKTVSTRMRIAGSWYRRSLRNFADDSLLFNTGVSFPTAFREATVRGFEGKIDVRVVGPFSGQISYSNMQGIGKLPVAGGLFLGNDVDQLLGGTASFPISQDQRNTVRSRLRFQPHSRVWLSSAAAYNSGLPFEIDGPANLDFLSRQYGASILNRVNFDRGRIRPSFSLDASAGIELLHSDRMKLRFQADAFNLTNRLNLINFAGVFSGTALDVPRSFAIRARSEFW